MNSLKIFRKSERNIKLKPRKDEPITIKNRQNCNY
jgi:hypothetical protein